MDDPPPDDRFTRLLAALDEAAASGDASRMDQLLAQHPEFADRLRWGRQCVELLQRLRPSRTDPVGVDTPVGEETDRDLAALASDVHLPQQFGRFEICRPLGRGGFGIVYLAYDPQLRRNVALKVPRFEALWTDELRQRFAREARAGAGLDHPNVAAVYEAGEINGVAYIASAYCGGPTLAEWLKQRDDPMPFGTAAELVAILADAIEHGHRRGVLHRDVKPGNVLLTDAADTEAPHDEGAAPHTNCCVLERRAYVPKIADFGLAKLADDEPHTRDSAALGTPSYMAPEQTGSGAGPSTAATDIYGLGAVFYELLTGRPPFDAGSELETLAQIRDRDPIPPCRLRPKVPRDLETICLKCLEKAPHRRYATAAALADDLRRALAGEPIAARPISGAERVWKWARRQPYVASLLAALVVSLAAGLAGIFLQWRRAEHQAVVAQQEKRRADSESSTALGEKARAEFGIQEARDTVRRLMHLGANLYNEPGMTDTSRAVLQQALDAYERLLDRSASDPEMRLEVAGLALHMAGVHRDLGQREKALETVDEVAGMLTDLAGQLPDDSARRFLVAGCHWHWAFLFWSAGELSKSEQSFQEAIAIYEELRAVSTFERAGEDGLANALMNYGGLLSSQGRIDEAEQCHLRAIEIQKDRLQSHPDNVGVITEVAFSLAGLGQLELAKGDVAKAEKTFREALAMRERVAAQLPRAGWARMLVAGTYRALADIDEMDTDERAEAYQQAIALLDQIAAEFPDRPDYGWDSTHCKCEFTMLLLQGGQTGEAIRLLREVIPARHELLNRFDSDEFPNLGGSEIDLAWAYFKLGRRLLNEGRYEEAEENQRDAIEWLQAVLVDSPEDHALRDYLAGSHGRLAEALERTGTFEDASAEHRHATRIAEQLLAEYPDESNYRDTLCFLYQQWGAMLRRSNQYDIAEEKLRHALMHREKMVAEHPENSWYRRSIAATYVDLAMCMEADCRYAEAAKAYRAGLQADSNHAPSMNGVAWLLTTAPERRPEDAEEALRLAERAVELKPDEATYWNTLGVAHYRCGHWSESITALNQALKLGGGNAYDWFFLAMAHWQLDDDQQAQQRYDRAVQWMSQHRPEDDELRRIRAEAEALADRNESREAE